MVTALQMPVFLRNTFVTASPTATPEDVGRTIRVAHVTGAILTPNTVEGLVRSSEGSKQLQSLKYLHYAGASIRKDLGDELAKSIKIAPAIGTTEAGGYLRVDRDDSEWEWLTFLPEMGASLEKVEGESDLYEMVFYRQLACAPWQQIFQVYADRSTFRTQDLFEKHATKSNLWRFAGRTDDRIKLSNGYGMFVAKIEADIVADSKVEKVLVGGNGMQRPFLLVAPHEASRHGMTDASFVDEIWPLIEHINEGIAEMAQFKKDMTLLADPKRPFKETSKGTIAREETFADYSADLARIYEPSA